MGSFDYTCAVSKLPIRYGDKIRYLLLTENPYEESRASRACGMHDWWFPRTFPLKAKYNDYGSVENVEDGPVREVWLDGLKVDLVEKGWGDNSIHDVPTSKDMSFEEMLEAVRENRLYVERDTGRESLQERMERATIPKGVPTMKRVKEKLSLYLSYSDESPFYSEYGKSGYLVDDLVYGTVRIRWHGAGEDHGKDKEKLAAVQKPLQREYATVLMAGDGPYANSAELRVHARPGTKDFHGGIEDPSEPLLVSHAMIREDVWQALLTLPTQDRWTKRKAKPVEAYREEAQELFSEAISLGALRWRMMQDRSNSCMFWITERDAIPFTVSWATHWKLMVEKGLSVRQAKSFLDSVAEMAYVHQALGQVRWLWTPSTSCGAQCGEFPKHAKFYEAMLKVAKMRRR